MCNRSTTIALTPLIFSFINFISNILKRASWHNMKKWGDRGSHCLNPILGISWLVFPPFISTLKVTVDTHYRSISHSFIKHKSFEFYLEEFPIDSIIHFLEIKFDSHQPKLNFSCFKTIQHFLNYNMVFSNLNTNNLLMTL